MELLEDAEVLWWPLKTMNQEETKQLPRIQWDQFYVSEEGLVSLNRLQQDVTQPFSLPSHRLGWEAPLSSNQAEQNAKGFIKFLEECGCCPTYVNDRLGAPPGFWFDASSEATHAYYRLYISQFYVPSWAVEVLVANVYRPTGEFDHATMSNITFLDGVLSGIARACGAQRLTKC